MGERNSAFELLRIVAIIFIMIHHVVVFGIGGANYNVVDVQVETNPWVNDILNSMCIIGVNLFILITGWFGVKSVPRSLFRLLPIYICVVIFVMIQRQDISSASWGMKEWWYVPHFIMLVLCSPLIEKSIEGITLRKFSLYIVLLTVINELFGYHWKYMNGNGYNFLNFIYLYYLARYLKFLKEKAKAKWLFHYGILIWLICSVLLGTFHTWMVLNGKVFDSTSYFGYNNPLVLLSSIGVFSWFSSLCLKSRIINFVAGGTFAVYLVSTKQFGPLYIGNMGLSSYEEFSYIGLIIFSLLAVAVLYVPCSVICWACSKIPMPKFLTRLSEIM